MCFTGKFIVRTHAFIAKKLIRYSIQIYIVRTRFTEKKTVHFNVDHAWSKVIGNENWSWLLATRVWNI